VFHTASPFYSGCFGDEGLTNYLPRLASNHGPPDLSLRCNWIRGLSYHFRLLKIFYCGTSPLVSETTSISMSWALLELSSIIHLIFHQNPLLQNWTEEVASAPMSPSIIINPCILSFKKLWEPLYFLSLSLCPTGYFSGVSKGKEKSIHSQPSRL
jgi:hypothetical protein